MGCTSRRGRGLGRAPTVSGGCRVCGARMRPCFGLSGSRRRVRRGCMRCRLRMIWCLVRASILCLGKSNALLEVGKALAELLRRYGISIANPVRPVKSTDYIA
ncbi:hypothetical protein B0H67DRAFT_307326 [Lasiosphaeris hirsuta]|uniref:Uncharacterized protein n=1 Tax=Lasiosphaeris hirsuta TaxID=260670 RepID=A0AA40DKQ7_9PEZI|nr:hypothetical protein B0H67DRAFT_307326 [Lasiosphaeris hirsuta]